MSSEDMNGLNSQLVFQDETMPFNCSIPQRRVTDPCPKTRELCGFMDDKLFPVDRNRFFSHQATDFRRNVFNDGRNWNTRTETGKPSDEDDDDDDDVDEADDDVEGLVRIDDVNRCNKTANNDRNDHCSGGVKNGTNKMGNGKSKPHNSFGSGREVLVKDGMVGPSGCNLGVSQSENHSQGRLGNYPNVVTIAEPDGDAYYSQYLQGNEAVSEQKDLGMENGCRFIGRRDVSVSCESESLRTILSDPVTSSSCSSGIPPGGRIIVLSLTKKEKRKDKGGYGDLSLMDSPRGRGVQFPFSVTDRVIIKGNKRTPQRFVGREAVVTTQCLNGWYVVKTLDNAESVKLQYRSLSKVPNDAASKSIARKVAPNWL